MARITLFAQVIQKLPKDLIKSLVRKHGTDKHAKGFNTWSHLVSMIFCQFADCVSLREISNGLHSANGNLNHLGIPRAPSKSNLAYQNEHRSCAFFRDCYYALLNYFGQQVGFSGRKFRFRNTAYALDSTVITLCAKVYDWARYTHAKGAVRLHTLLNFHTMLPDFVHITDGKTGDNTAARNVEMKPGSIVVCDRGYFDTLLMKFWDSIKVFFIVRVKDNLVYERIEERGLPDNTHQEVLLDEIVRLTGNSTSGQYPKSIRRIAVYNAEHHFTMVLLTNNIFRTLLRNLLFIDLISSSACVFSSDRRSPCTTLLREVRLRFGSGKKKPGFFFPLRSPCTTFACEKQEFHFHGI